jgi:hypothetical protein
MRNLKSLSLGLFTLAGMISMSCNNKDAIAFPDSVMHD